MELLTFEKLKDYFESVATSHVDINDFIIGPSRRILEKNRSKITYPAMWMELPDMFGIDNGAHMWSGDWQVAVVILKHANPKDFTEQDQALIDTEEITRQVLAKMIVDHQNRVIEFDLGSVKMEAVSTLHLNSEWGWRMELTFPRQAKICYDPDKWS